MFYSPVSSRNVCACHGESSCPKDYGGEDCLSGALGIHISLEREGIFSQRGTSDPALCTSLAEIMFKTKYYSMEVLLNYGNRDCLYLI